MVPAADPIHFSSPALTVPAHLPYLPLSTYSSAPTPSFHTWLCNRAYMIQPPTIPSCDSRQLYFNRRPALLVLLQISVLLSTIRSTRIMCQAYDTNCNAGKGFATLIACSIGLGLRGLAGLVMNIMGAALFLMQANGARWGVQAIMNFITLLRPNDAHFIRLMHDSPSRKQ